MGQGAQQQVAQTTNEPWAGQAPHLNSINQQARAQYISGGPQYYPGSTVAGFSPQQQRAMDMATSFSESPVSNAGSFTAGIAAGSGVSGALNNYGGAASAFKTAGNNKFNNLDTAEHFADNGQAPWLNSLQGFSGMATPELNKQLDNFSDRASGGEGYGSLRDTASGNYLGANPYLDQVYDTAARKVTDSWKYDIMPGVNSSFGMHGRSGGGLSALALGDQASETRDSLNDLAGSIYAPAYENERNRMAAAGGQMAGIDMDALGMGANVYNNERGLDLSATQTGLDTALKTQQLAGNLYMGAKDNQLAAAQGQLGVAQGMGQLGMGGLQAQQAHAAKVEQAKQARLAAMQGVGDRVQNQSQALIDANVDRYNFYQNSPYVNLGRYSDFVNRSNVGGTSTKYAPGGSRGASAVGAGMTGAGIGGQVGGGWGALIGGGLGAAAGYYGYQ